MSLCAIFDCDNCNHRKRRGCVGCVEGNATMIADGEAPCAIFECVSAKGLPSCKECSIVVCQIVATLESVCPVRAHYEKKRCYARKISDYFTGRHFGSTRIAAFGVSDRTIARLRWYLFALDDFLDHGIERVSSQDIERKVGVKSWLIRRDLSHFGGFGRRSIGYDTAFLRARLAEILHLDEVKHVVWVGAACLAHDPSLIERFESHGFKIAAVLDDDPASASAALGNLNVLPLSEASQTIRELKPDAAVISGPAERSQAVADLLITSGARAILNMTSAVVVAPAGVVVRNVDVVAELFALSYYCGEKTKAP